MRHLLYRADKALLIACGAALLGWSAFAYARIEISGLRAERDAAVASHERLQQAAGSLGQVEQKLGAARVEYGRTVQAWGDAKTRLEIVQRETAVAERRLEQVKERVSQTGSIRTSDAAKGSARKP